MLKFPVTNNDHIQGDDSAPITLLEYGDYQCPYCGAAYPIVKQIQKHFDGKLRLVFRNFPLVESHPYALVASIAAEFAATKNKFWEMHDMLYENQLRLDVPDLITYAKKLHLPGDELSAAIEQDLFKDKIEQDFSGGIRSGVNGTPTFFINGKRHDGPFDFESLRSALENIK